MVGGKAKNPKQKIAIAYRRRLLQQDGPVNHGKIGVRKSRSESLKMAVEGGLRGRYRFEQAQTFVVQRSGMAKIHPHPAGSIARGRAIHPNVTLRGFVLRFPRQHVVITALAIVKKSTNRTQKLVGRTKALARRIR